jgi:hypothetical protein
MRVLLWVLSVGGALGAAYGLYHLEHEVKTTERQLARIDEATRRDGEAIQVLQAEWSYLNRPERLQELTARHLTLSPSLLKQIVAAPGAVAELPRAPVRYLDADGELRPVEASSRIPLPAPKPALPKRAVAPPAPTVPAVPRVLPVVAPAPSLAVPASFRVEDIVIGGTR